MRIFKTKFLCELIKGKVFPLRYYTCAAVQKYRVLFFGSDDVALRSLKCVNQLYKNCHIVNGLQLVTANRSKNLSIIEKYAVSENLKILPWPVHNLEIDVFDIGIVVSFGHLIPEETISKFPLGMVNVHTSLLPRWRGAAPVVHTLLNGDTTTGVTLMSIKPHQFDIGEIISQEAINVPEDITLPKLTSQLGDLGAEMVAKCLEKLPHCLSVAKPQSDNGITYAKKIDKSISIVKWEQMSAREVYNLYRATYGLYPLTTHFQGKQLKLFDAFLNATARSENKLDKPPGSVEYSRKLEAIKVWCKDKTYLCFKKVRIVGKREISAFDFYNGYLKKTSMRDILFN